MAGAPKPKLEPRTRRAAEEIGRSLRDARLAADVSQERLAAKIGMTRGNLARIEQGQTNVTLDSILRIATGLELKMSVTFRHRRKRGP